MNSTIVYHQKTTQLEEMERLTKASNRLMYRCRAIFPFDLFPDSVLVDQNKIDIVYWNFFFSRSVFTIMLDDLKTIKVDAGLLFATLYFEVEGYEQNPTPVKFLPKNAAFTIRRLIMGLMAARRQNIDLNQLDPQTAQIKAEEIGATQEQLTGA